MLTNLDAFYTPSALADKLLSYCIRKPRYIIDFCAGGGELLSAAERKWMNSHIYAADYSKEAIDALKISYPKWKLFKADFLNNDSLSRVGLSKLKRFFDLILLNPPFTCKGSSKHKIYIGKRFFSVSTAMLFLSRTIPFLSLRGVLLAILPSSVCFSEKDNDFWSYLSLNYNLEILESSRHVQFGEKTPNIIIISLSKKKKIKLNDNSFIFNSNNLCLQNNYEIFRGKLSLYKTHNLSNGKVLFIHTTNLQCNKIVNANIYLNYSNSEIEGPAVLFPRVGNFSKDKIVIINAKSHYILSDCIIAIKTKTLKDAKTITKYIYDNWDNFQNIYNGTGAKYTTLKRIRSFLGEHS